MSDPVRVLNYVDLFSGCGGLSLGLEKAGFNLALAVEKSDMAAETFYHNFIHRISDPAVWKAYSHKDRTVQEQAEEKLIVKELSEVLENKSLLKKLKNSNIDLVAGGPPCQGFSLAGRRNSEDIRNQLPWQFLQFVEAVRPKAVIIENVSGMSQNFVKNGKSSPFNELRLALKDIGKGYKVQPLHLNAKHFGVPQNRPRVMLIGVRIDISRRLELNVSDDTWKSEFDYLQNKKFPKRPSLAPEATHLGTNILKVKDAIWDLSAKGYNRRKVISAFAMEMRTDTDWMPAHIRAERKWAKLANHSTRKHAPQIEKRFAIYQYLRDCNIHPKVFAIPKDEDLTKDGQITSIKMALKNAKFPAKAPNGTVIAKTEGELVEVIMQLGTKKHSQRPLDWNLPSPTVVSLPDDYVHPQEPRTLTVRELARFQTFPDAFEFRSKETTGSLRRRYEVPQYTQVGNAVPPRLAMAIGKLVHAILLRDQNLLGKTVK
jgi:DNA (cytosine-5)-methyltransferase 1